MRNTVILHRLRVSVFLLFPVLGILTGCGNPSGESDRAERGDVPNFVLIVSDDHGTGDMGAYGNKAISTPNLDYLASEGIRFNQAYCTSASCSASRSVILSGLYNHANGQYGHQHHYHHFSAFDHVISLPVFLEELAGYQTARIGKYHVAPGKVFRFMEVLQADSRNPVAMADSCLEFIEDHRDDPFFLYFCTSDPHRAGPVSDRPTAPNSFGNIEGSREGVKKVSFTPDEVEVPPYLPESESCREELAQYYQSVARVDQGAGRLFEYLKQAGVWDNTVVIYISDNGIAFAGAKTTVYQPGINLPCLVKNTNSKNRGEVSDAMINWADLAPTILDLAGILPGAQKMVRERYDSLSQRGDRTVNPELQGHSFSAVLENPQAEGWDETYASHTFHEITMYYPMRSVITRKYKLVWNIASELPYPHASDLWNSSTWQAALKSRDRMYGVRTVEAYTHRPEFELYDLENDPYESRNLARDPAYTGELVTLKEKIRDFQEHTRDPWILKWKYE